MEASARKVIAAVAEGDMLRTQMAILRRLAKYEPADTMRSAARSRGMSWRRADTAYRGRA